MKKYNGTLYRSKWDGSTWLMIALIFICCILPFIFDDDGLLPAIVCFIVLLFTILTFTGIYYRIDGNNLVVYQFFFPTSFPIDKITDIRKSKSFLSAPATSLKHRIEIRFSDRSILKSVMPLIISPATQSDFINELLKINPNIKVRL
ncbi:MAG: PH domain-containing protein [Muribaculaceae bacterium]|nr:PH domain-containing protein [Muribaculaceae bacterium]